jgi:hypothetical protein
MSNHEITMIYRGDKHLHQTSNFGNTQIEVWQKIFEPSLSTIWPNLLEEPWPEP